MASTPEGKIKRKIMRLLVDVNYDKRIYFFMAVPMGFGKRTVDYLLCVNGCFVAIEAKAPGEKPTDKQAAVLQEVRDAGGTTFVVRDDESLAELAAWLKEANRE